MLACARIGAPHTVVFGGFSAESLSARMNDMECEVLITQDEAWRRGTTVPLKAIADEALADVPGGAGVRRAPPDGRRRADDRGPRRLVARGRGLRRGECPCEPMDSEDLLFLMYTSGTTAKPKGIAHTTAGYLVGAVVDAPLRPRRQARRRRLLVRGRRRLDHRPLVHRLRAAGATGRPACCTRARPTSRTRTAGGRSSSATA